MDGSAVLLDEIVHKTMLQRGDGPQQRAMGQINPQFGQADEILSLQGKTNTLQKAKLPVGILTFGVVATLVYLALRGKKG